MSETEPLPVVRPELRLIDDHLPGGRTEVSLDPDGSLTVERTSANGPELCHGRVDPAVFARILTAIQSAPPGLKTAPKAARTLTATGLLPDGDAAWADGTPAPVPGVAQVLAALAAQVLEPSGSGRLPNSLLTVSTRDLSDRVSRHSAAIGTVRGRPAYALAEQGQGFGLAALDGQESLGGSDTESGLLPSAVALAAAGERELFAVGGHDGAVQVWDAASGALLHGTSGGEGRQTVAVGVVQDVTLAFSGGERGEIRAWRADDGRALGLLPVAEQGAAALTYARCADLDLVASAGDDAVVRVWNVASGEQLHLLVGHTGPVTALAILSLGEQALLASAGQDREVRLWDLATGQLLAVLTGHSATVTGLAYFELDGRPLLASCSLDDTVRTWDVYTAGARYGWAAGAWPVTLATTVVDGAPVVVTGHEHGELSYWEPATGRLLGRSARPQGENVPANAVAAGQLDGRPVLAAGYGDGTLRLWDATTRQELYAIQPDGGPVTSVGLTSEVLVCGTAAGSVRCHNLRDGAALSVPTPHTGPVSCLAFDGGSRPVLASGGEDDTLRVRDALSGMPVLHLTAHQNGVTAVAVGEAEGHRLFATAGRDRTVRLWAGTGGHAGPVLHGLPEPAETLDFGVLADRAVVIGGSADGTVLVWDVRDGSRVASLAGGGVPVRALACQDMDGEVLLAAGDAGAKLRLWHLASGTLLNEAELDRVPLAIAFGETGLHVVGPSGATML